MAQTQKWFYPAQHEITKHLNEKFGDNWQHNFQDVFPTKVYENYLAWKIEQGTKVYHKIQVVIYKPASKLAKTLVIFYYSNDSETIQV